MVSTPIIRSKKRPDGALFKLLDGGGFMRSCLILSGGEFHPFTRFPGEFVIACDRGYEYALRCQITPDLVVSDFDSYSGPVAEGIPVNQFQSEKDDTDTMIALRYAAERGFEKARFVCAFGGRLDHTLANLQSAVWAEKHGLRVAIESPDTLIFSLRNGSLTLPRREGFSLSVFAMEDTCRGVSICGAKYELDHVTLTSAFPLGVSNEWKSGPVEVSVEDGILLIVLSKM